MSHITTTPLRQRLLHTSKSSHLLTLILMVTLLAWGNCAWAETVEKVVYSTNFQDWDNLNASTTATPVPKKTTDNQDLTFTLYNTTVKKDGTDSKFTGSMCTAGWLQTAKDATNVPYITTSALNNITKFELVQAATGGSRGVTVYVKGDGDADWVELHNKAIASAGGETLSFTNVNKTNCQIKIGTFAPNQNAYVLSLKIYGNVEVQPRTFTDFKIDFTKSWASATSIVENTIYYVTSADADGTPTYQSDALTSYLATFKGKYHNATYGITSNPVITIPVDGPVKIYYGTNDYGADVTVKDANGNTVGSMNTNGGKWNASKPDENLASVIYNSETPTVLTLTGGGYIPFIKAEACDYIPTVTVTYYNTNGAVIGTETVDGNSPLAYKYSESNVTVPDGSKFRGWFDKATNGKKVAEGTPLNADLNLYAVATPIEVTTPGSTFTYDLTKDYFYQEDHEGITIEKGKSYNNHGWQFEKNGTIKFPVSGNADLTFTICCFSVAQTFTITDEAGNNVGNINFVPEVDGSGNKRESSPFEIRYVGPATTLTFTLPSGGYIHEVVVANDAIPASDLTIVEGKDVITLNPNGTYQLRKGSNGDFTTSSAGAITYSSSDNDVATVSETGLITAGSKYGTATITVAQAGNTLFQEGSVQFTVRVVSAQGQTAKPSATVGEDGKVYLKGNDLDSDARIYYTTDGSVPTDKSTEFTDEYIETAPNTIVRAIAIYGGKSPSDIINIYVKVPVTLTWDWNSKTTYSVKPRYSDETLKELFDNNTQANIGNNFEYKGASADVTGKDYAFTKFQLGTSLPKGDKNSALQFNVLTKAGLYFKPTATSATIARGGTNTTENVDISIADETTEKYLGEGLTPNRYDASGPNVGGTGYCTYSYDASHFTDMAMTSDLSMYIYTYKVAKDYYYADITIDGIISGSLYEGEFYNVGYDIEPAESGYVVQKPSVSSVMAGKTVVFNATPAEGYKFINWTKTVDGTILSTDKTFIRTITEATYVTANFQKIPLVTFSIDGMTTMEIKGNVPAAQHVNGDTYKLNIPANYVLYREGYTMTGWTDGEKTYELGMSHRFDKDVTLKPKFQRNEVSITDTNEKVPVRWDLNHRERPKNAPELNVYTNDEQTEKSTGVYTRTAMVNGMPVDMKMVIRAPGANTKLDNRDMTVPVTAAQVNPGTQVTIPAVPGMKVILKASTGKDDRTLSDKSPTRQTKFVEGTTIPSYFGDDSNANHPTRVDDYTAEYIYHGDANTITLTFEQIADQGRWGFYEWIEVEYPVLQQVKLLNSISDKLDREKNENAGTLDISDPAHTNTGKRYLAGDVVTISAEAQYGYTITGFKHNNVALANPVITNDGKSATVAYTIVDGDNTVYAEYARQTTYAVRVITADSSLGEVTLDPIFENFIERGKDYIEGHYVEGTQVKLKSEAGEGNVLSYWMDGDETWKDEESHQPNHKSPTETITVSDHGSYMAYFKPGEKGTVIFDLTGSDVDVDPNTYSGSKSITPATLRGVRSFNVPTNFTFFKPGYTLERWKVKGSENTYYELGQRGSFTSPNQEITLVPVFRQNNTTQENRTNNPVIRYDFGTGIFNYDDPTKGETRKVSAQKVSIPSNTKTFWTSKVWTEVLVGGEPVKNWRDVAMWVNTGAKGFVRNGDLPEWAAFGPGTTLEVASGSGTKFSIMTYAPITTTTIDGVVPVLDEGRSNPANHEYVYTHTTRSAEDRVKIVIGDDYSYYKWLEAATLKANMVDFHIKTADNVVGEVTSVKSWDEENYPSKDLDDGGHSFQKGNKVIVTFYRKFGADFHKIIDPAKDNLPVLEMLDNGKVSMVCLGNGTELETLDRNQDGTWGGSGHVFKLTMADADNTEKAKGYRTKYVVEFEITNHRDLEILFKEKPTYYVTFNTGKEAIGVSPSAKWVEAGDSYTIGSNQTLYYEGHTLDHWVDLAGNVYNIGTPYQMSSTAPKDMLLYPVFRQNTFSLLDLTTNATAMWDFRRAEGAPTISYQRINGIYVTQVSNGESTIDVKLDLIGTNGKIDNKNSETQAQINDGSKFLFPVTHGCEISLTSSSANYTIETTKICGKNAANDGYDAGPSVTSPYSGEAGEGDVAFAGDGRYYTQFSITYKPQNSTTKPTLTSVTYGDITLNSTQLSALIADKEIEFTVDPDFATDALPEVTATAANGEVVVTQADINRFNADITLKTAGGMIVQTYSVKFKFNTPTTPPRFIKYIINGVEYPENTREITVENAPVSGTVTLRFDRTMKALSITSPVFGTTYSAEQGKDLVFRYWNLPVNTVSHLQFPASIFEDVYGGKIADNDNDGNVNDYINIHLHVASTPIPVEHKTFDYIVGQDGDINAAVAAANANRESGRYYIYVPDGEHELTGNEISSWKAGDETTDENGVSMKIPAGGFKYQNHMTVISRSNVSLIGQSQENTILYNHPKYEGIGCTATIHVTGTDDYLEELTLENRFPYYKANFAGRAVAFWDQGNKQVLKNVSLLSYQDTYYSHSSGNYRGYFEDCVLAGTVDWLCGNGDIWLERCGIMVRNRVGNNIAAPATTTPWGYVFNNCTIYPEEGADLVTDRSYTLGRPWQGTPSATYLNTTFKVLPRDEGWQAMQNSYVLKFHEYNSMDTNGHPISLGSRTLAGAAPLKGSDDIILTEEAARQYTTQNVLGGGEAFDPVILCQQIDARSGAVKDKDVNSYEWNDEIEIYDDRLQWHTEPMALCYFVFKKDEATGKWKYVTNVAQSTDDETVTGLSLELYGNGIYCVRAANQRGGLGAATAPIHFTVSRKYTLEIKKLETIGGVDYGWSTLCLPYNSKVPADLKVYAANGVAYEGNGTISTVDNYNLYLKEVTVVNKDKGYIVYGPVGTYLFASSSQTSSVVTILGGNPNDEPIPTGNNNCYVLANKETYGLGFYKYTGTTLAAHRAWLPVGSVSTSVASNSAKAIKMVFTDEFGNTTAIGEITADGRYEFHKAEIYDLNGIRVQTPVRGRVYIINGEKRQWK